RKLVFNRMGFNNEGAVAVAARVRAARSALPGDFRVGVNIGKNKDTPPEGAHEDYRAALRPFEGLVDYVVVNVSSPNTPGLRSLQGSGSLGPIVGAVVELTRGWSVSPPVLVKLAPEMKGLDLAAALASAEAEGAAGFVLTNTLQGDWPGQPAGGLSGSALVSTSAESLREARLLTRLPIISVGGILDRASAVQRQMAGAALIQVYSGWVFGGPRFPARITRALDTAQSRSVR
ncbi:MAG: hypothetical protein IT285_00060, partial [Bdellovibrionales bacterium]|nr:hypothetical protein [Bdellovibrionales bacterium]